MFIDIIPNEKNIKLIQPFQLVHVADTPPCIGHIERKDLTHSKLSNFWTTNLKFSI